MSLLKVPSHYLGLSLGLMLLSPTVLIVRGDINPNSSLHVWVFLLSQQEGDLRLSGYGASRLAGRLEIYLNNEWGTICADDNLSISATKVACRQLRLGHAIGYQGTPLLRYGVGNGAIWLEDVNCRDRNHNLHLLRCRHSSVGVNSSCDHHKDVSIMCSGIVTPYEGEVRLVSGDFASEGIVELYMHRQWAPVCSTDMEPGLADTVCRQLGYTGANSTKPVDNATGLFWQLPSSHCSASSEPCARLCLPDLPLTQHVTSCDGGQKTWWIVCEVSVSEFENATSGSADLCVLNNTVPEEGKVRLYGDDPEQGRVEVYIGGMWASLLTLGMEEATVVCKQQGFPTSLFSRTVSTGLQSLQYEVDCTGLETHITDCTLSSMSPPHHSDDAYVHCSPILWPYGSLRLIGGAGPFGLLQINVNNKFHWLCDAHFSTDDADVACRQMGYNGAIRIVNNSLLFDPSLSPSSSLLPYSLHCSGGEEYLIACQKQSRVLEACRENLDAVAVHCGPTEAWKVRLESSNRDTTTDSDGVRVGRVKVLLEEGGEWGTVCAEGFSDISAHVICRQLGFVTFNQVFIGNATNDPLPILLSSVQCTGFEKRLDYCTHTLAGRSCTHAMDISVNCSGQILHADGSLRLINSTTSPSLDPQDGRLEVSYHGIWMSVCGVLFTQAAADVACKHLGFGPAANFCQNACAGRGAGAIHFAEYSCVGSEDSLLQCGVNVHRADSCSHDNDVGLSCLPPPLVVESSTSFLHSSPSPNPSLSSLILQHVTSTSSQPSNTNSVPSDPFAPTEKNVFVSDRIFFVVVVGGLVLLVALIVSVTVCCVRMKKKEDWDLAQTTDYVRRDDAINHGANGEVIREAAEGEDPSDFDFDAVAEAAEEKACSKAVEAMELPPDRMSLSSAGLPPQYHELEFLSHSIPPPEDVKELP